MTSTGVFDGGAPRSTATASGHRLREFELPPRSGALVDGVGTAAVIVVAVVTSAVTLLVIATGEGASEEDASGAAYDRSAVEAALVDGTAGDRRRRVRRFVPSGRGFRLQLDSPI